MLRGNKPAKSKRKLVLIIWDGFGIGRKDKGDATGLAKMPTWRKLLESFPHTQLKADGASVGLPAGQPGNSEAGHATLGAGRPVISDQLVIDEAIDEKKFSKNPALRHAVAHCERNRSILHLVGLLTNHASGHASPKHIEALIKFAAASRLPRVALHLFTDGRDTPPFHAVHLLAELQKKMPSNFVIATLSGRFYAMDRNRFWDRTMLAYDAMTQGHGVSADSVTTAVTQAYNRGESDEFITPTVICKNKTCIAPISDHDSVIYWNLRSDRARQLVKPFVLKDFNLREPNVRRRVFRKDLCFVTLTEFGKDLNGESMAAFPHADVRESFVDAMRYQRQIYIAESEKFAQVTYFFNGGFAKPLFGEERVRIPSLRIPRYDAKPRMRADEIAKNIVQALDQDYQVIVANFANADMVGHTGNEAAAIQACDALDETLALIWKKVREKDGILVVTADHGNVEVMLNPHGGADTEHNPDPVPFLVAGSGFKNAKLKPGGLADVAPTLLHVLGVDQPKEMTGKNLLV
ncbi:MAG: 2,3-bisphosphoglycerate-independent phosphoglycerate mutase [Patescibacteria group bacterium]